ncbi:tyrosine 3-monooxygenase-like [Branchiostoma floridae]|uniref:Tyrosine 3-monooxygenase-like n=1 Tax=Branchiostoma floridae TaxID=7739 RepID=A0A9J7KKQ7_BRAFL|nr:tyrosine 3-monooxygenase-like [Branchiostoma floridae]
MEEKTQTVVQAEDDDDTMAEDEQQPKSFRNRIASDSAVEYQFTNGYHGRRRSLIDDARAEKELCRVTGRRLSSAWRQLSLSEDDEDLEVLDHAEDNNVPVKATIVFSPNDGFDRLPAILDAFKRYHVKIHHIESRPSQDGGGDVSVLVRCERDERKGNIPGLVISLKGRVKSLQLFNENGEDVDGPWFPKVIADLDKCHHLVTKFEPELDADHPGFSDKVYRARRKKIADAAFEYRHGQPLPVIEYTEEETETWGIVYNSLTSLYQTHSCKEHIEGLKLLEKHCGYSADEVPQLEAVSNFLKERTGWQLRPVAGLVSARDFLASLAFRVFQCTQYLRHGSKPHHSPEPDCCHELLGHVPMLSDPSFAQFSQEIGLLSLGASDEDIEKLATCYWFTVEFGLCRQDNKLKAYGAGLLSSYGELEYALSGKPEIKNFEPEVTAVEPYDDVNYQDVYFVSDTFDKAKEQLRSYASRIQRPFEVTYDPYTQSVEVLDSREKIQRLSEKIKGDVSLLNAAMKKIIIN